MPIGFPLDRYHFQCKYTRGLCLLTRVEAGRVTHEGCVNSRGLSLFSSLWGKHEEDHLAHLLTVRNRTLLSDADAVVVSKMNEVLLHQQIVSCNEGLLPLHQRKQMKEFSILSN
ncbi:hypothetical protein NQ314_011482 [Rhamnusium bicolor]|uniref:Uncharacterized protein n=1 Tax=Rhamnusium bicolor TaxID=1586634 RepID=A0AAV8XIT5_9CUCU|nr:hypothetical protein NQ314_011482 [Rhamnusium bicolor]